VRRGTPGTNLLSVLDPIDLQTRERLGYTPIITLKLYAYSFTFPLDYLTSQLQILCLQEARAQSVGQNQYQVFEFNSLKWRSRAAPIAMSHDAQFERGVVFGLCICATVMSRPQ
jgi:hypothetical protein